MKTVRDKFVFTQVKKLTAQLEIRAIHPIFVG